MTIFGGAPPPLLHQNDGQPSYAEAMTLTRRDPMPRVSGHRPLPGPPMPDLDRILREFHRRPTPPAPDFPIYRKGARVTHLDHGRGTVVETNTSATVYVEFDEWSGGVCGVDWHYVTKIGVPQPPDRPVSAVLG